MNSYLEIQHRLIPAQKFQCDPLSCVRIDADLIRECPLGVSYL